MIRFSKMADYGVVVLAHIATHHTDTLATARGLSEAIGLPLPTTSKVLKTMARHHLLTAHRGKFGGYSLSRDANTITLVDILNALDGPIAMTDCAIKATDVELCDIGHTCLVHSKWQLVNRMMVDVLSAISLTDMLSSPHAAESLVQLGLPTHTHTLLAKPNGTII